MARILLVDTNVSSFPIYKYLYTAGHEVYVIGGNPNDTLAKCVPNYIRADYSDIAKLQASIDQHKFDYLVPGCNDASYTACSLVNKDGRFPGIETPENNEILNNKEKFRTFALMHKLPVPKVHGRAEIVASCFPLIVKPADAFSGRGIAVIQNVNFEFLDSAIVEAQGQSKGGAFVIEEFVSGQLYSHSAFIKGGSITADVVVEEHCTANPFAVDTSRVVDNLPATKLEEIRNSVETIAKILCLKDGLFHTQFICNGASISIVEPTRRCPGDLYSRLIEMSTGMNYAENYARPFLGLTHSFATDSSIKSLIVRHTITDSHGGYGLSLRLTEPVKVREFISLSCSGDRVKPAPAGRVGLIFIEADTKDEMAAVFKKALSRRLYKCIDLTATSNIND